MRTNITPTTSNASRALQHSKRFCVIRLHKTGDIIIDPKTGAQKIATGKEANWPAWAAMAPPDSRKIEKMWAGSHALDNVGLRMGPEIHRTDSWLLAIDEDTGGAEQVMQWEKEGKVLPPTYTQTTWSGKKHKVFRSPRPIARSIKGVASGIDILGCDSLIVGSGSRVNGYLYTDNGAEIVAAPEWLLALCDEKKTAERKEQTPVVTLDQPGDIRRAIEYLTTEAKPAIEGQAGDLTTLKTAAHLKDLAIGRDKAKMLMAEFYNARCSPPWSTSELDQKIDNAYNHCHQQAPGEGTARAAFDVVEAEPVQDPPWLLEMNTRHFLVNASGRAEVYTKAHDSVLGRDYFESGSLDDLKKLYSNKFVTIRDPRTGRRIVVDQASAWQIHPHRHEYLGGVRYAPGEDLPVDTLNLWQGLAVAPKQGSWGRMKHHLYEVICDRNDAAFAYLMNWLARLVQFPGERGRVAVVCRGAKGSGKGLVGNAS
jgi:hypothetical protein